MEGEALDKFAELTELAADLHTLTTQRVAAARRAVVGRRVQSLLNKALDLIRWLKNNAGQAQSELGITTFTVNLGVISVTVDFRQTKP